MLVQFMCCHVFLDYKQYKSSFDVFVKFFVGSLIMYEIMNNAIHVL